MLDVLLFVALATYFIGPFVVWATLSQVLPAEIEPTRSDDADALQELQDAARSLQFLGFRELGAFRHRTTADPVRAILFVDAAGTTSCLVALLVNRSIMIELQSESEDRSAVLMTNNAKLVVPMIGHRPGKCVRQFPGATAGKLYEAHKSLATQQLGNELRHAPPLDLALHEMKEDELQDAQYEASRGWAKIRGNKKRPTLKGAFLMSWRLAWPVSPIRRHIRTREHNRALQAAVEAA
jgi:hypothetical protein